MYEGKMLFFKIILFASLLRNMDAAINDKTFKKLAVYSDSVTTLTTSSWTTRYFSFTQDAILLPLELDPSIISLSYYILTN